ncbi:MAG: ACP S-malonyltransferase [Reinekea sp.]|jgi:[acyl-carrier-protein] S-malonyltransferase
MSKLAFVFPGQGAQSVGMLADFIEQYDLVRDCFVEASDVLGYSMTQLVLEGPVEELGKTEKAQPALLTASTALFRLWHHEVKLAPELFAGHSLGEYSALVASGTLAFADAVKLVELRGQLMQKAVPAGEGLMAAILGLSDEQVVEGCLQAAQGQVVSAVNFNTPGQVVIAGAKDAVERAIEVLKAAGAKRVMPLNVSVPSHCAMMRPAADALAETLHSVQFNKPSAPIVQNRTAQPVSDVQHIRSNLLEQLYQPVLWTQSVEYIAQAGIEEIVECGPGKVLTGLNKRIAKGLTHTVISDLASFQKRLG